MDKLAALTAYVETFRAKATQLNTRAIARTWMEAGIDAETAAAWASHGFAPEEALPLIASGMTPELATATDPQTEAEMYERLATQIDLLNEGRD